jgi:hypothetical protein
MTASEKSVKVVIFFVQKYLNFELNKDISHKQSLLLAAYA